MSIVEENISMVPLPYDFEEDDRSTLAWWSLRNRLRTELIFSNGMGGWVCAKVNFTPCGNTILWGVCYKCCTEIAVVATCIVPSWISENFLPISLAELCHVCLLETLRITWVRWYSNKLETRDAMESITSASLMYFHGCASVDREERSTTRFPCNWQ